MTVKVSPKASLKTYDFRYKAELWCDGERLLITEEYRVLPVAFRDCERDSLQNGGCTVYLMRYDKEKTKEWVAIAAFQRGREVSLKAYPYPS